MVGVTWKWVLRQNHGIFENNTPYPPKFPRVPNNIGYLTGLITRSSGKHNINKTSVCTLPKYPNAFLDTY